MTGPAVRKHGVAAAALAGLLFAGCGGSSGSRSPVPVVVSGQASTWTAVTISAEGHTVDVPSDARGDLTPLLATRALGRPAPLSEYGLDHPQATLSYRSRAGTTTDVDIGQPNFDRHFLYVQRRGQPGVYLVAADALRPVLALVGIEITPPE